MIAGKDFENILSAAVPMYFPLALGYIAMRWLKFFTAEQSAGISRFLRAMAIPLLVFHIVSSNNLLHINLKLFAADSLQKLVALAALFLFKLLLRKTLSLDRIITLFSLFSLPNTVIIGLPMTTAMYGQQSVGFMVQTLVFQSAIWVNVLVVLYEYRAASIIVAADRLKMAAAVDRSSAGEFGMVDLSASKQVFPHEDRTVVSVDREGDDDGSIANRNGNGGFPASEISTVAGGSGGGSVHSGLVLEHEKEDVLPLEDPPSKGKARGTTKLVFYMLWKKIIKNPMTYASVLGIIWSLISFKYGIKMPTLIVKCISTLGDTANAISMLSLGIFMAVQPNFIACSMSEAASAMGVRFLVSPILIAILSKLIGLNGLILHTAIIQAAFPPGVISFVFAKEYNVNPNIISTSVVVGMLIAVPILLVYYIILGAIFK